MQPIKGIEIRDKIATRFRENIFIKIKGWCLALTPYNFFQFRIERVQHFFFHKVPEIMFLVSLEHIKNIFFIIHVNHKCLSLLTYRINSNGNESRHNPYALYPRSESLKCLAKRIGKMELGGSCWAGPVYMCGIQRLVSSV